MKISVIIPAFNSARVIEQTIASVLQQTFRPYETIVVNDGSTDDTLPLVQSYPQIRVINKTNGGASSARNAGILSATGDWIAFLDADDVWLPGKLRQQVLALKRFPNAVLSYCGFRKWNGKNEGDYRLASPALSSTLENASIANHWLYHKMLLTNWVLTSTAIVEKQTLFRAGLFDQSLPVAEDWDLFIRLSRLGTFCKVDEPLVLYRDNPSSLTSTVASQDYASFVIDAAVAKYGFSGPDGSTTNMKDFRFRSFHRHFNYGIGALKQRWSEKALLSFRAAVRYKPFNLRLWAYLVYAWARLLKERL